MNGTPKKQSTMSNSFIMLQASRGFVRFLEVAGAKASQEIGKEVGPLIPDWVWILIVGIFVGVVIVALLNKD
jgi:hypothetical protein